jgi:hypothetical protein
MPLKKTTPRSLGRRRAALPPGEALAPAKRAAQILARLDIAKAADRRVRLSGGKTRTRPKT